MTAALLLCCSRRKEESFRKFSERTKEWLPLYLSPFEEPIATPTLHYKHLCWLAYKPEGYFFPLFTRKFFLFTTDLSRDHKSNPQTFPFLYIKACENMILKLWYCKYMCGTYTHAALVRGTLLYGQYL